MWPDVTQRFKMKTTTTTCNNIHDDDLEGQDRVGDVVPPPPAHRYVLVYSIEAISDLSQFSLRTCLLDDRQWWQRLQGWRQWRWWWWQRWQQQWRRRCCCHLYCCCCCRFTQQWVGNCCSTLGYHASTARTSIDIVVFVHVVNQGPSIVLLKMWPRPMLTCLTCRFRTWTQLVFSGPVRSGFLPPNKATDNLTGFLLPKIDITATATALNWCKPVFLQFWTGCNRFQL